MYGSNHTAHGKIMAQTGLDVKKIVLSVFTPPGKRMGHGGAIISGSEGTAEAKALEAHGIPVARTPGQVVELVGKVLK